MDSLEYLKKKYSKVAEEVEELERQRSWDRNYDLKVKLMNLKKEKLRIRDQIALYG